MTECVGLSAPESAPMAEVFEHLLRVPGAYALMQALDITARHLRGEGKTVTDKTFRYSVNPALSFPSGDIAELRIDATDGDEARARLMLNLLGLHGAASPLPAYFTEYVAQHADEPDALRELFDIFNHRLVSILPETWSKYRYYARYRSRAVDALSMRFSGFMGVGHRAEREAKNLRWPRLMAYMGLIVFSGEATGSMENVLRHYLSHEDISVVPCIRRWVDIPQDQQTCLGTANSSFGDGFLLGTSMPDQTGKFRIRIGNLSWRRFNDFLPSGNYFDELQTLISFILRSRLDFEVELRLRPGEIPEWRLEESNECRLGWSVWAGGGGDGVVVL